MRTTCFRRASKTERNRAKKGFVLYCTHQCPFNAKYVPVAEETAKAHGVPFRAILLGSREEAQNAPTPVATCALFRAGEYLANEQMNDQRFLRLIGE